MQKKRTNTAVWLPKYARWQINVQRDGIRRTFTSSVPGRTGQREANAKADRWLDEGIENEHITVAALWAKYLESRKTDVGAGRYRVMDSFGRTWLLPKIGKMQVGRLTEVHLQDLLDAMARRGLSHDTILSNRATITSFMRYARRARCSMLVPDGLTVSKKAPKGEKTILMPDELKTLFAVDETCMRGVRVPDWYVHAYRFAVLTGLRPGELRGLQLRDRFGDTLTVSRSVTVAGEITTGKNQNARRSFVLTPMAAAEWDAQVTMMDAAGVESDWLFPNEAGNIPPYQTLSDRWHLYCRSNGIREFTLYELRHTFVSIVQNLPEGYLKALVGHSASMDTRGTYAHEKAGDAEKTAALVQDIFSDFLPKTNTV